MIDQPSHILPITGRSLARYGALGLLFAIAVA
jgi:hypothetical protein